MVGTMRENLIELLNRVIADKQVDLWKDSNSDIGAEIKKFCSDYVTNDEELIEPIMRSFGVVGVGLTVPRMILLLHIGLVLGMRYTFEHGCPTEVRNMFRDKEEK